MKQVRKKVLRDVRNYPMPMVMGNMKQNGGFFCDRGDGLGVRLVGYLNAARLAQTFDVDFKMHWRAGALVPELNDPWLLFNKEAHQSEFGQPPNHKGAISTFTSDASPNRLKHLLGQGGWVQLDHGFSKIVMPWEDADVVQAEFLQIYKSLYFHPHLLEARKDIAAALSKMKSPLACHIRRGDTIDHPDWLHSAWPKRFEPDAVYETYMADLPQRAKNVVLFSDTHATLERFKSKFPLVTSSRELFQSHDLAPIQRDFCDLFSMSCCEKIIGPRMSAFSAIAAELGNIKYLPVSSVFNSDQRKKMHRTLLTSLTKEADSSRSYGETAQMLHYADVLLTRQGKVKRASRLINQWQDKEKPIIHLLEHQIKNRMLLNEYSDIDSIYQLASRHNNMTFGDFPMFAIARGYAALQNNDLKTGADMLRQAIWTSPNCLESQLFYTWCMVNHQTAVRNNSCLPTADPAFDRWLRRKVPGKGQSKYGIDPVFFISGGTQYRLFDDVMSDWAQSVFIGFDLKKNVRKGLFRKILDQLKSNPLPDTSVTARVAALCLLNLGSNSEALRLARDAVRLGSDNTFALHRLGRALRINNLVPEAIAAFSDLVEREPDNPFHRAELGFTYQVANEFERAIEHYVLCETQTRGFAAIPFNKVHCLKRTGDVAAAKRAIDQVRRDAPFSRYVVWLAKSASNRR